MQTAAPSSRSPLGLIALAAVPAAVAGLYAAAMLAWRAGFHPALGAPLWAAEDGVLLLVRVVLGAATIAALGLAVARRKSASVGLMLAVVLAAPAALVGRLT